MHIVHTRTEPLYTEPQVRCIKVRNMFMFGFATIPLGVNLLTLRLTLSQLQFFLTPWHCRYYNTLSKNFYPLWNPAASCCNGSTTCHGTWQEERFAVRAHSIPRRRTCNIT